MANGGYDWVVGGESGSFGNSGGCLYISHSQVTIDGGTFRKCDVFGDWGVREQGLGGAVFIHNGRVSTRDSTFDTCSAGTDETGTTGGMGGAIVSTMSIPILTTIYHLTTTTRLLATCQPIMYTPIDCTIPFITLPTVRTTHQFMWGGDLQMTNTTIKDSSAVNYGGALAVYGQSPTDPALSWGFFEYPLNDSSVVITSSHFENCNVRGDVG